MLVVIVFSLHFQPEKMAEGLLLFIQGLGLGKISILHVLFATYGTAFVLCWNKFIRVGQRAASLTMLELNDSFRAELCCHLLR